MTAEIKRLFLDFISLKGYGAIWFLPVMFFAEIIFYWFRGSRKILSAILVAVGIAAAYLAAPIWETISLWQWGLGRWAGGLSGVLVKFLVGAGTMAAGYLMFPLVNNL